MFGKGLVSESEESLAPVLQSQIRSENTRDSRRGVTSQLGMECEKFLSHTVHAAQGIRTILVKGH